MQVSLCFSIVEAMLLHCLYVFCSLSQTQSDSQITIISEKCSLEKIAPKFYSTPKKYKKRLFITLTLSLPEPHWVGGNADLPSDSNISKALRINIAFVGTIFKEYLTSFLIICRLIEFALVALKLLIFKVCVIIGISKMELFSFPSTEGLRKIDWLFPCFYKRKEISFKISTYRSSCPVVFSKITVLKFSDILHENTRGEDLFQETYPVAYTKPNHCEQILLLPFLKDFFSFSTSSYLT